MKLNKATMSRHEDVVKRYVEAKNNIKSFMDFHRDTFEEFKVVAEQYNAAVKTLDACLRAATIEDRIGYEVDGFTFNHVKVSIDADQLIEEVGEVVFQNVGGRVETVRKFSVDTKSFEHYIETKKVSPELAKKVLKVSPVYSVPPQIQVP